MVYKNRWTGELTGDVGEGVYWTNFFKYILLEEKIDATKNRYKLEKIPVDTKDNIRGVIDAELWAWVLDGYKYYRIGTNDAMVDVLSDFETTIKSFISSKTEKELRSLQDHFISLDSLAKNDTLKETLLECGLLTVNSKDGDKKYPSVRLGPFIPPKEVAEANAAKVIAQRKAEADAEENMENSKRVNLVLLKKILNYVPNNKMLTVNKVTQIAVKNLGLENKLNKGTLTPSEKFNISEEAIAVAKKETVNLTYKKLEELEKEAELAVNIREKRTRDINIRGKAGGMFLNEK
jgi:hypothetical protein